MDVGRLNSERDKEGIAQFLADYEHFKFPYNNISYPKQLKGNGNISSSLIIEESILIDLDH